jgi:exosortase E/protease (VPEID-CTERM system)
LARSQGAPPVTVPRGGLERPRNGTWLVATLLLGEFVWLVSHFTTGTLPESDEPWVLLMKQAKYLPQIGLAVVTMLLLFRRAGSSGAAAERGPRTRARFAVLLLVQLVAFGFFERFSSRILEQHLAGVERPLLSIAAWAILGVSTALLGVLLFHPLDRLLAGLRQRAGMLIAGSLLGLCAWGAGYFAAHDLSRPLRMPTLWLAEKLLGLFESNFLVDYVNFDIRTFAPEPGFWVRIASECSGFEGMGLMAVFSISYVWFFRGRLKSPHSLLLPVIGIAGMWVLNVLRIVTLVLIGTHYSREVAEGGFHSLAGTFTFCLAALALVALSTRMAFFAAAHERDSATHERDATAAYLLPLLASVALGMLAVAVQDVGDLVPALKVLVPAGILWCFRRSYPIALERGLLASLLFGALAFGLWVGLQQLTGPAAPKAAPPAGAWLVLRVLGSVGVAPLVEELAFRGFLMRRLCAAEFEDVAPREVPVLPWAISSLLFGLLHGHWIAATLAGGLYGLAYMRRGRLLDGILAHAFTNFLLLGLALATGDWSLA